METILIVDDEKNYLVILEALLAPEGYEIITENNVANALRIIRETDLDLVITDMKMPGKDGMELLEEAKKIDPELPVIIMTAYGTIEKADYVIINADFAHAMTHIVEPENLKKWTAERLASRRYSCSTFMLYLGINKIYDNIPHHNIMFSDDYRKYVEEMTTQMIVSDDISFYVQNASVTDPTLAPEGKSTIYVLVPVPNNKSTIDWEEKKSGFRDRILDLLENRADIDAGRMRKANTVSIPPICIASMITMLNEK